jgi:hypothetical protein
MVGGMPQVVDPLPRKQEAMSSKPSTEREREREMTYIIKTQVVNIKLLNKLCNLTVELVRS